MMRGKLFPLLFLLLSVLFLTAGVQASRGADNPVRIGYMNTPGFIYKNEDGSMSGFCYDYLMETAKYADWKYEFVYGIFSELAEKLDAGEVDFLCAYTMTPERREKYDFSRYSIGTEATVLYVLPEAENIFYEDYAAC